MRKGMRFSAMVAAAACALSGCVVTPKTFQAADGKQTLTVWSYMGEDPSLVALKDQFLETHPDVEVEFVAVPINSFGPKLVAAAAQGEGPDVIVGNPVADFSLTAAGGTYADITEQVEQSDNVAQLADQALWRDDDGRVLALQWRYNVLGLWFNRTILDEYGLEAPETIDELDAALDVIANDGKYQGITLGADPTLQSTWALMQWLLPEGVNYCNLDSPRTVEVLDMINSWRLEGAMPADISTVSVNIAFQRFLAGDTAFVEGGSWELRNLMAADPDFEVGTAPMPGGRDGSGISFAGESVAVGAFADHPDLAWEFIDTAFMSEAGQLTTFELIGAIPTRDDVRADPRVGEHPISGPFVTQLDPANLRPWPDNVRTLDAQTDLGVVFSNMLAGALTPAEAAEQGLERVQTAFERGNGGC